MRDSILAILNSGTGLALEFADLIYIGQLEDLRFNVIIQPNGLLPLCEGEEFIYEDAEEAVDHFMKLRADHGLGFDYETGEKKIGEI
tara:strand:+ start:1294 stop:1554 length:261 start_codon:yes stop_codon:yes gene_type:complete